MIKFFRKIRQQLLSENRLGKYLLYAIGEILLVIIGILMALQINNWNTERVLAKESKDFTVRLLSEVRTNIKTTDLEIAKEQDQISSTHSILKMFNSDRGLLRSRDLDSLVYIILIKNEIDLTLATLDEGLNTGKIPLIRSDTLRNLLYGLPTTVKKVTEGEKLISGDIDNFLAPFLYEHLNWRTMDYAFSPNKDELGHSGFPEHNSLDCLDHMRFENLVDNIFFNSQAQLLEYKKLRDHLELLDKMLRP